MQVEQRLVRALFVTVIAGLPMLSYADEPLPADAEGVGLEIQRIAGVPAKGTGLIDAYVEFARARSQQFKNVKGDFLPRLAEQILAGSDPSQLEHRLLDQVTAADSTMFDPNSRFGSFSDRLALAKDLWDAAEFCAKRGDPAPRVTNLARAALVAAAGNVPSFGAGMLASITRADGSGQLLNLDPAAVERLKEISASLNFVEPAERFEAMAAVAESLDRMISSKDRIADADVETFVKNFRFCWRTTPAELSHCWKLSNMAWRLACLAKARHDQNALDKLSTMVKELASDMKDPFACRWIGEVLTLPGPIPSESGWKIVRGPNDLKPRQ